MDATSIQGLSPGIFAIAIKSPHTISSASKGSPSPSGGVATLPGNSAGTFDFPTPSNNPLLGQNLDLFA